MKISVYTHDLEREKYRSLSSIWIWFSWYGLTAGADPHTSTPRVSNSSALSSLASCWSEHWL